MNMHITFKDGSTPYVMLNASAPAIKRKFNAYNRDGKMWLKARVDVWSSAIDGLRIRQQSNNGYFAVFDMNEYKFKQQITPWYFRFGNAVNALGRISAKKQQEKGATAQC